MVKTFWMTLPSRMPRRFTAVSKAMTAMASAWAADTFIGPQCRSLCDSENQGRSTEVYLAKATATAAMVPVWITRNSVQPYRNPMSGP